MLPFAFRPMQGSYTDSAYENAPEDVVWQFGSLHGFLGWKLQKKPVIIK
jgi:hypothetical protein